MRQLSVLVLLCCVSPCFGTSYAEPRRHDVYSPNKAFVLDVNPKTEVHNIYAANDRKVPLWSFTRPVWHSPWLLSNDGKVVAMIAWEHVQEKFLDKVDGVQFWNAAGRFKAYSLKELCPDPPRTQDITIGPIGEFWRTWYRDVYQEEDELSLQTTIGKEYRFRITDGAMIGTRHIPPPVPFDIEARLKGPLREPPGLNWKTVEVIGLCLVGLVTGPLLFYKLIRGHKRRSKDETKDLLKS